MNVRPAALLAATLMFVGVLAGPTIAQSTDTVLTPRTFVDVSKRVLPAVVSIDVEVEPSQAVLDEFGASSMEDLLRNFMNAPTPAERQEFLRRFGNEEFGSSGAGSGVVVEEKDGWAYVVTNTHVVEPGPRVNYRIALDGSLSDDQVIVEGKDVEVVGSDSLTDVAVLRFRMPEGLGIPAVRFADSDKVEVGEWVLALGNPLELNNSVSQGIVSAKNRTIGKTAIESLLQTTAVINPGNSGGPLVNLDGDIVGINNAIATTTGRWAGVGFAIPSNQVRRVADAFISEGELRRGYLGIEMDYVTENLAKAIDLEKPQGVLVRDVKAGTPAALAGVSVGDIIVSIDRSKVRNPPELLGVIGNRMAGDEVTVDLVRFLGANREDVTLTVKLMARPGEQELAEARTSVLGEDSRPATAPDEIDLEQYGLSVGDAPAGETGFEVTNVTRGSLAWKAGLRAGDILVQMNGMDLTDIDDLSHALENVRPGKAHVILRRRSGSNGFLTMDQPE